MLRYSHAPLIAALVCMGLLFSGCMFRQQDSAPRVTRHDKTAKAAAIGAAAGAVVGVLGEGEADDILAGAAVGAAIGAGVGAYMDRQEERLARIPGTTVERVSDNLLLVHFDSDLLFDVGSAGLSVESRAALDETARVLMEYRKTAVVSQGHTDGTGSETYNLALSERRARAVVAYLAGIGVAPERMTALGHGEGQPVASDTTEDGRRLNRRVDLLLKAKVR